MSVRASETLIDALVASLRGCQTSPDGQTQPAAILWTDPEGQWKELRPMLRAALPELLELGEYAPDERRGPGIWLRCVVDRTLPTPTLPEGRVPILYLPGVAHQSLRAGEECAPKLRPLVELLFRGKPWLQKGGHDWTVSAFLTSPHGLELVLARDHETAAALARALSEVAQAPLSSLRGRTLEAEDFDKLLASDVVRDLLRWMGDPTGTRERMGPQRWASFCAQTRSRLKFDPEREDVTTAGERLGLGEGEWADVWARFEEAPRAFPGIPELLRRSQPAKLTFDKAHWPKENDAAEEALRAELCDLEGLPHAEACRAVVELEREHRERRTWIWVQLGLSPMAKALESLAVLAQHAQRTLAGTTPDEIAATYERDVWRADAAAWQALIGLGPKDADLVGEAVHCLLETWLDDSARAFQAAHTSRALPGHEQAERVEVDEGGCVLFVDGLRYDVGRLLAERLEGRGMRVRVGRRWAALPTITSTAKPAVAPVSDEIQGREMPADFAPTFAEDGAVVSARTLRAALEQRGYQMLDGGTSDWPQRERARGWCETGKLDERGHFLQADLVREIETQLEEICVRIDEILQSGWSSVRIVTDHGWLLVPGGLPKIALPKHLTVSRWSRCAAIAGDSSVDVPVAAWHWNAGERFATAPGIGCFNESVAYAHGGISIQECLTPDLLVERGGGVAVSARIQAPRWQGMRCFFRAEASGAGITADLRIGRPNGKSAAQAVKSVVASGETSLLVEDDAFERVDLVLVLLAPDGSVIAQRRTKVGDNS